MFFFLITAGICYFGFYYYIDHPIFKSTDNGISEKINKIDDLDKIKSVTQILIRSKTETAKNANQIIDSIINIAITVSLTASAFFMVNIINIIKLGRASKSPNKVLKDERLKTPPP